MMKKLLAILLAAILVIGLSACGGISDNVRGKIEGAGDASQPTKSENFTQSDEPTESDEGFEIGTMSGSVYKNEFLGITAAFGSEWHLYSEQECKDLNEQVLGSVTGDYAEQLKNADYFYDMMADIEEKGYSVNVIMQNMGLQAALTDIKASLEQSGEQLKTGYANMGYTDITYDIIKAQFVGKKYDGALLTAKIGDTCFYMKQVLFMKGKYAVSISVGTLGADDCDKILDMFTAL